MWIRESHHNESFSTNYSHIICHDPFVQSVHPYPYIYLNASMQQSVREQSKRFLYTAFCLFQHYVSLMCVFLYLILTFSPFYSPLSLFTVHPPLHSYSLTPFTQNVMCLNRFFMCCCCCFFFAVAAIALLIMLMWIFSCDNAQ